MTPEERRRRELEAIQRVQDAGGGQRIAESRRTFRGRQLTPGAAPPPAATVRGTTETGSSGQGRTDPTKSGVMDDIAKLRAGQTPTGEWADKLRENQDQLARTLENIANSDLSDSEKQRLIDIGTKRQDKFWLWDALETIDRYTGAPVRAGISQIEKVLDSDESPSFDSFLNEWQNNVTFSEILSEYEIPDWLTIAAFNPVAAVANEVAERAGINLPIPSNRGEGPGGFLNTRSGFELMLDIFTDPTTYLGGSGAMAKLTQQGGLRASRALTGVARAANEAGDLAKANRAAQLATRFTEVGFGGLNQGERRLATELLRESGELTGRQSVTGGAYLRLPGTEGLYVPGTRALASVTYRPAALGIRSLRNTRAMQRASAPFATVQRNILASIKSGDQARIGQALEALAARSLAEAESSLWFVEGNSVLDGLIRRAKKLKVNPEELSYFLEDSASMSAARLASRYEAEPAVQALLDDIVDFQRKHWLERFNAMAGREAIATLDNYVPTLMSDPFLAKMFKNSKGMGDEFSPAGFQKPTQFRVGEDYMGIPIVPAADHPAGLTPKQQGEQILRAYWGDDFVGAMYDRNWFKAAKNRQFVARYRLRGELTSRYLRDRGVAFDPDQAARVFNAPLTNMKSVMARYGLRRQTEQAFTARQTAMAAGRLQETAGTRVLRDMRALDEAVESGAPVGGLLDQFAETGRAIVGRDEEIRKLITRRRQIAERVQRIEQKLSTDTFRMAKKIQGGGKATPKEQEAAATLTAWSMGFEPDEVVGLYAEWARVDESLGRFLAEMELDADDISKLSKILTSLITERTQRLDNVREALSLPPVDVGAANLNRLSNLRVEKQQLEETLASLNRMNENMTALDTSNVRLTRLRDGMDEEQAFNTARKRILEDKKLTAAQKRERIRQLHRQAPMTARHGMYSRAIDRLIELAPDGVAKRVDGSEAVFVRRPLGMQQAKLRGGQEPTRGAMHAAPGRDLASDKLGLQFDFADDLAPEATENAVDALKVNVRMNNPRMFIGVENPDRVLDAEMLLAAVDANLVDLGALPKLRAPEQQFVNEVNAVFARHTGALDEGPEAVMRFVDDLDETLGRLAEGATPNPVAKLFVDRAAERMAQSGGLVMDTAKMRRDLDALEGQITGKLDDLETRAQATIDEAPAPQAPAETPVSPTVAASGDELLDARRVAMQRRQELDALDAEMKPIVDAEDAAWKRYTAARQSAEAVPARGTAPTPELQSELDDRVVEGIRRIMGDKPSPVVRKFLEEDRLLRTYSPTSVEEASAVPRFADEDLTLLRDRYRTLKSRYTFNMDKRPLLAPGMVAPDAVPGKWWTDSYRLLTQGAIDPATKFRIPTWRGGPLDLADILTPKQIGGLPSGFPTQFASTDDFVRAMDGLPDNVAADPKAMGLLGRWKQAFEGDQVNFPSLLEGAPTPANGVEVSPRYFFTQWQGGSDSPMLVLESADGSVTVAMQAAHYADYASDVRFFVNPEQPLKPFSLYIGNTLVGVQMPIRTTMSEAITTQAKGGSDRVRSMLSRLKDKLTSTTPEQRKALYELEGEVDEAARAAQAAGPKAQELKAAEAELDRLGMKVNDARRFDQPKVESTVEMGKRRQELERQWSQAETAFKQVQLRRAQEAMEGTPLKAAYDDFVAGQVGWQIKSSEDEVVQLSRWLSEAPKMRAERAMRGLPGPLTGVRNKKQGLEQGPKVLKELREKLAKMQTPEGRAALEANARYQYDELNWLARELDSVTDDTAEAAARKEEMLRVWESVQVADDAVAPGAAAQATPTPQDEALVIPNKEELDRLGAEHRELLRRYYEMLERGEDLPFEMFNRWDEIGNRVDELLDLGNASPLGRSGTGEPFEAVLFRGSGAQARGTGADSVLGPGLYASPDYLYAATFGDVSRVNVRLENPLVLRGGEEWRALTKEAGWPFPDILNGPYTQEQRLAWIADLRSLVERRGHDGIIARAVDQDVGAYRTMLGNNQVVVFNPSKAKAAATQAPTPPAAMANQAADFEAIQAFRTTGEISATNPQVVAELEQVKGMMQLADDLRASLNSMAAPRRSAAFGLIDELVSPAVRSMARADGEEYLARLGESGAWMGKLSHTPDQVAEAYKGFLKRSGHDGVMSDDISFRRVIALDPKQVRPVDKASRLLLQIEESQVKLRNSIREGQERLASLADKAFGYRIERQTMKQADARAAAAENLARLRDLEPSSSTQGEIYLRTRAHRAFKAAEEFELAGEDDAVRNLRIEAQSLAAQADQLAAGVGDDAGALLSGKLAQVPGLAERIAEANSKALKNLDARTVTEDWIVEMLTTGERLTLPGEIKGLLRAWDWVTNNVFKSYAIMTFGFHIRNLFGGVMNNWLGGVNVESYQAFMRAESIYFKALRKTGNIDQALRAVDSKLGKSIGEAYRGWHKMEASAGLGIVGAFSEDAGRGVAILSSAGEPQGTSRLGSARAAIQNENLTRERLTSPKLLIGDNAFVRSNAYIGQRVERFLRGSMAFDTFYKKGGDFTDAMLRVRKYHFDYQDLSNLERNVLRRIIPFYVWVSRSIPLQIEGLITKPKVALTYWRVKEWLESSSEEEATVPNWFEREGAIRTPFTDPLGNRIYWMPDLPLNDLAFFSNPVDTFTSSLSPLIKVPIEIGPAQRKFFTGEPFTEELREMPGVYSNIGLTQALEAMGQVTRDKDGKPMADQRLIYSIEQGWPLFARLTRWFPSTDEGRARAANVYLSNFLGVSVRSNDDRLKANETRRQLSALDEEISKARGLGSDVRIAGYREISDTTRTVELNMDRLQYEVDFLLTAVNTFDAKMLEEVPGIGETTARWIVLNREANGEYTDLRDLMRLEQLSETKVNEVLLTLAERPEEMGLPSPKPIDLNSGTAEELEEIKGIGPSSAAKIIDYRTRFGPITNIWQLDEIDGITRSQIEEIRNYYLEDRARRDSEQYRRYLRMGGGRPIEEVITK